MSVLLPASVSCSTLASVCPDDRRTGAYREHTPLLLEAVTCIMPQSGLFMQGRALTFVVALISAGVISRCTSRCFRAFSPHSFSTAALAILPVTDSQSLNDPAALRPPCTLPGPRSASLLLDPPHPQSRVLHGPMLHETKVPGLDSHLASGTFTASILHTKWDLTGHTRRPSKRFPPGLPAVPAADPSPPAYLPWGNTDYYPPKEGGEVQC